MTKKAPATEQQPKRRQRAPMPVILRLRTDLEPNENHPLGVLSPEKRSEQRERLIASILARLAAGPTSILASASDRMEVPKAEKE